jgi:hypothetical protein
VSCPAEIAEEILDENAREILWERGLLTYKLWPQQRVIYDTIRQLPRTSQTVVVLCARQWGKSCCGVILALEDCLQNPNVLVMIIGPSIKQTRDIVRPRMKLFCTDMPEGMIKNLKSEDTWYFSNGSELKLGGFDTNSAAQRGKTIHKIYMEETCDSEGDDYIDFLQSDLAPALTHSLHAQIIHLTTLPKVPDHPFVLETIPEAALSGAYFKFTIHDNLKLTRHKYDACVKVCGGEHTTAFKREYLCEQVRDSSIILVPEFDEARHVMECAAPAYCYYWVGGDTGIVRDLSVFHLCTYDFKRAKILFLDEYSCTPDIGTGEMVSRISAMEAGRARHAPYRHRRPPAPRSLGAAQVHRLTAAQRRARSHGQPGPSSAAEPASLR